MPSPLMFYAHATLCLLLAGLLTWQALRLAPGWRRWLRLLAGLLAAGALWLSVFPPQRPVAVAAPDAAILLTESYPADTLRVLRRRLAPVPVLRYRPQAAANDTATLASLAALVELHPQVRRLHVLGIGLPESDLPALPASVQLIPHQSRPTAAFTAGSWNRQLVLGTALRVEGHFTNPSRGPLWLRLVAAGAARDSVQLPTGQGTYSLRYLPRSTGRLLARLEARRGARLLATEPVPALVQPNQPLRLLVLAGSPSFELNLLKNHLAERGHQVALRVGLSRVLQQTEFLNRAATSLQPLSPRLLATADVVIADAEALSSLSAAETRSLAAATADGLGLLVLAPTELPRALPARADFALLLRSAAEGERPLPLRWPEGSGLALLPATLRPSARLQPLITGERTTQVAAASRRFGWGQVVVTTAANTYRWQLSGDAATYGAYWSRLLTAAARPAEAAAKWSIAAWPRLHEPAAIELFTANVSPRGAWVSAPDQRSARIALRQQPGRAQVWQAAYWPATTGWHSVQLGQQAPEAFYVFGPAQWQGPLRAARQTAARLISSRTSQLTAPAQRQEPWPVAWFFALFVAAAGWLWLDEKR